MSFFSLLSEGIKLTNHGLSKFNQGTDKLNNHLIEINKKLKAEKPIREAINILDIELSNYRKNPSVHMIFNSNFHNIKNYLIIYPELLNMLRSTFNLVIAEGNSTEIESYVLSFSPKKVIVDLIKNMNEAVLIDIDTKAILKKPEVFTDTTKNYLYYVNRGDIGCLYYDIGKMNIKIKAQNNLIRDINQGIENKSLRIKELEEIEIIYY